MRPSDRKNNEMRTISFETGVSKHAEGSCLVKFGKVLLCVLKETVFIKKITYF